MFKKIIIAVSLIAILVSGLCLFRANVLEPVVASDNQFTGVAVSKDNRVFVNFPAWSENVKTKVAEVVDGKLVAYPDESWNSNDSEHHFTAVQSVYVDSKDRLWVLETNNVMFKGVNKHGPKLYQFNLETNTLEKTISFEKGIYKQGSYFNDVRVDVEKEIAYITDSGDGAIIVVDLVSGESRRLLDNDESTQAEFDHLMINGKKWQNTVHSDGIALTKDGSELYFVSLTGHTLYKVKTVDLLFDGLTAEQLASKVKKVEIIPATDGMLFDDNSNLFLGGLEDDSINVLTKDNKLVKLMKSKEIKWADSFAKSANGDVYFTTSQIHLDEKKRGQYFVYKIPASYINSKLN